MEDSQEVPPLSLVLEMVRADKAGDADTFSFKTQTYLLRIEQGRYDDVQIAWDEAFMVELAALRQPDRTAQQLARMGEKLRGFLPEAWWESQEKDVREALQANRRVVLTLCFAAAELYALPWELLTLRSSGQHLGELPGFLCHYTWPNTEPRATRYKGGLSAGRILMAWSAAGGAVPAAEHIRALSQSAEARRADSASFDPDSDVLSDTSCKSLCERLDAARKEGRPITALHILCHGAAVEGGFGLAWNGDDADGHIVSAAKLRQVLAPYADMVRLIVLCACDSGNAGAMGNLVGSLAQTLHRSGFAHIVASRYPLSVSGSVGFAQSFYLALLTEEGSLAQALLAARRQMFQESEQLDWTSVQLYARRLDDDESIMIARSLSDTDAIVVRPDRLLAKLRRNLVPLSIAACALLGVAIILAVKLTPHDPKIVDAGGPPADGAIAERRPPPPPSPIEPNAARHSIVLFKFDADQLGKDSRFQDFSTQLRLGIRAVRSELEGEADGAFKPLLGHFEVITNQDPYPDLKGLENYWKRNPSLALLTAAFLSNEDPPIARSDIYLGELQGRLARSTVHLAVPVNKKGLEATRDGYKLVTLYALAMEARRRQMRSHIVSELLSRAKNHAMNLKEKKADFEDLSLFEQAIDKHQAEFQGAARLP